MAGLGWVNIATSNASVIGADNGVLVKVAGSQSSGSAELQFDSTNKKLTITGTSATSETLAVTGNTTTSNATVSGELLVGADLKTISNSGQLLGQGNSLTITGTQVVPADYRSQVYGPISISTDATVVIGTGAIIAVRPDADLPAVLSS